MNIGNNLHAFFNPEEFQGRGKKRNYFEGWYYKLVDKAENSAFAVIPGIALDAEGKGHAFIQLLDGKKKTSVYHTFNTRAFSSIPGKFCIAIEENIFSARAIQLNLPGFKGNLNFSGTVPWPKPLYSPGIMGPYAFIPFMECYHGIVSMDHEISGLLETGTSSVSFDQGRGYIEKDWGRSFPSAYIWLQSNHFSEPGISVKVSVAKIPWLRSSFVGFIAGIWLKDRLIRFTTYNKSHLRKSLISRDKVELVLENRNYRLEVMVKRDPSTPLASPILGAMNGRIEESMTSEAEVRLLELKSHKTILKDVGRNTGLEVAGEIDEIII